MNFGSFKEVAETASKKLADCPLGREAGGKGFDEPTGKFDKPLGDFPREQSFIPQNKGDWTGEPGNSEWKPDRDYVPPPKGDSGYNNPEGKTWGEILDKYGIDGIPFKDGEPDFSEVSKGEVEIDGFSDDRSENFDKADIELAKQKGCTPEEVAKWRKENGYTWHECKDQKTMQKVPHEVHANVPHSGGISEAKKGEAA